MDTAKRALETALGRQLKIGEEWCKKAVISWYKDQEFYRFEKDSDHYSWKHEKLRELGIGDATAQLGRDSKNKGGQQVQQ